MSRRRKDLDSVEDVHAGGKNKGLAILIVLIIALAGVGATATYWMMSSPSGGHVSTGTGGGGTSTPPSPSGTTENPQTEIDAQLSVKYSSLSSVNKKVIGELFVQPSCSACPIAEDDLKSIESQRNDFYFVSFVLVNMNDEITREGIYRYEEMGYSLRALGTPDTEFDGGYERERGAVPMENYTNDIEACKNAPAVPVKIAGNIISESSNTAKISVNVLVGDNNFKGKVRAFVIDKNSNLKNTQGEKIPNVFLGYLLNDSISLSSGNVDKTGQWKIDSEKSFSELAIVIAVYDSSGHAVQAYRIDL